MKKVTTQSSLYFIDDAKMRFMRIQEDAALMASQTGLWTNYQELFPVLVGEPLTLLWVNPEGRPKYRVTTPVLDVRDMQDGDSDLDDALRFASTSKGHTPESKGSNIVVGVTYCTICCRALFSNKLGLSPSHKKRCIPQSISLREEQLKDTL